MKLNLGCNTTRIKGFKNVDINRNKDVDIVCNIFNLKFAKNSSIDEIYASHCLEHLPHSQTLGVLKEWSRVLKKDSKIYIAVPDFDKLVEYYISNSKSMNVCLVDMLYGRQDSVTNFHHITFTYSNLLQLMSSAGFRNIKKIENMPYGLKDCSTIIDTQYNIKFSLNVEGIKS